MVRSRFVITCIAILSCASTWAQTTTRVSVDSTGVQGNGDGCFPVISADGRYVVFDSSANDLVPADTNGYSDVFVHDQLTGSTTRVSVDSTGAQGNDDSFWGSISSDGRYVTFTSYATNLVPGSTNPWHEDVFVHDRQTGVTAQVSVDSGGAPGFGPSGGASISSDGRYVAFGSSAPLALGQTYSLGDVYVHDLQTGAIIQVSVDSTGLQANAGSINPSISADGRYVAFQSSASNFVPGDTNGTFDIFMHDCQSGLTTRVSVDSTGSQGNDASRDPSISSDGRYLAFDSIASNLVPGDTNGYSDVFVHDMQTGATTRVSVDTTGVQGNGDSDSPSISSDGRYVAFNSLASNLVPGDTNGAHDVFVHDRQTGATKRVSVDSAGLQGNNDSGYPSISADGHYVAFGSGASNLVPGDTNLFQDAFVRDRGPGSPFCFGDGTGAACPCANVGGAGRGCQNSATSGGAVLTATGNAMLSADTVQLTASYELPTALSIVLQGSSIVGPGNFGDGLRCAGGTLWRLYVKSANGGVIAAPEAGDLAISTRVAGFGDPIPLGATRIYQVYYRDPNLGFCPGGFNVTNAMLISWGA